MRSNSGKDEGRNNLHDPTLRDRDRRQEAKAMAEADGRSTGMGSHARKTGQDGDVSEDEEAAHPVR